MAGCCAGGAQQNVNIYIKQLQIQAYMQTLMQLWVSSALDVQVAFFQVPDFFDSHPADVGDAVQDRTRALCLATQSWVDQLLNDAMEWIEDSAVGVTAIGIGAVIIPTIPTIIAGAAFAAAALALSALYEQANDPAYREYLACAMFNALKGVSISNRTEFANSWDNLPPRPPPPEFPDQDLARDAIEAWGRTRLNNTENYLAFVKQMDAAMGVAQELTDSDCPCLSDWSHSWLFGNGNQGDIAVDSFCNIIGSYNAIDDRWESLVTVPPGCLDSGAVSIKLTIPPGSNVTEARMRFAQHNEQVFGRWVKISSVDDWLQPGHVVHAEVLLSGVETDRLLTTTVAPGAATELFFSVMNRQTSGTSGRSKILQITLEGTGADPFV